MEPKDLNNGMHAIDTKQHRMGMMSGRISAILSLYRNSVDIFMSDPNRYDPAFNAEKLALKPKPAQQRYFKRVAELLLVGATETIVAGEKFNNDEIIRAVEKVTPKQKPIDGVILPDIGGERRLGDKCECKHAFGEHVDGAEGPCTDMACMCKGFKAEVKS